MGNLVGRDRSQSVLLATELKVPVVVISLDDMSERRQRLLEAGLPASWVEGFFPATDMRESSVSSCYASADVAQLKECYGRELSPAEIGCAVSHKRVYESLVASNYDLALILEDDSVPEPDFMKRLSPLCSSLLDPASRGESFICNVGLPERYTEGQIARLVGLNEGCSDAQIELFEHLDPRFDLWRANAYLVSRQAATDILRTEPNVSAIADDWSRRRRRGSVRRVLFTDLPLFSQDLGLESTLEVDRSVLQTKAALVRTVPTSIADRATRAARRKLEIVSARLRSYFPLKL